MEPTKLTEEEAGKEALKDMITVVEKLSPYCNSFEELVGMARHALENDGQLRLLLALMKSKR